MFATDTQTAAHGSTDQSSHASPIRVDVRVAHPLVSAGLHAVLRDHSDIQVLEPNGGRRGDMPAAPDGHDVIVAETTDAACRPALGGRARSAANGPHRTARVVAVGDCDEEMGILTALCSGVRGFVGSRSVATELPAAVRAVARGEAYMSSDMAGTLLNWFSGQLSTDLARFCRAAELLSVREREVLALLGSGYSNSDIAGILVISETTVRSHLYHILTKLDLPTRTQAVLFGYQFRLSAAIASRPADPVRIQRRPTVDRRALNPVETTLPTRLGGGINGCADAGARPGRALGVTLPAAPGRRRR